jgi:phosphohistidine phosphatase
VDPVTGGKVVLLLRHAKSSWDDPDAEDHARPLNARGRAAAGRIGRYLRECDIMPELVLCSSAVRARETLALLALDPDVVVRVEDGLYGASVASMVNRLRQVDDAVTSVLLIGHNPDISELAQVLASSEVEVPDFPTAALAELLVPVASWADLVPGAAALRRFVTPRRLG